MKKKEVPIWVKDAGLKGIYKDYQPGGWWKAIGTLLLFILFGWWFFIFKKLYEIHKFNIEEEKKEKKEKK
jgi:hypothetical protein